ncbi:9923_t:CDS:2 [Diversispora eburnea]|uniref:9923_t:CDS:1 n=1 Tax=Diversispora eburnea TaxID=1213867 RepID=A0A9N8W2F8_9GLOM|nr:9923_t:CDS:2 [Diversispora eburnea]
MIKKSSSKSQTENFQQNYRAGITAFKENNFERALEFFTKAIKSNSKSIILYDCRAVTCEKLGLINEALHDAEFMMKLDKSSPKGYLRAGKLYRMLNNEDKAQEVYSLGITNVLKDDLLYKKLHELKDKKPQAKGSITNKKTYDLIAFFPPEIVHEIFNLLPFASICKTSGVSKTWRIYIVSSPFFYRELNFTIGQRSYITDQTIRTYLSRGKSCIKHLICRGAPKLTDTTMRSLRSIFGIRLQGIEITANSSITNNSIITFIRTIGGHLKYINFSKTLIADTGVKAILITCNKLETLDLSLCEYITSAAFDLKQGLSQCKATELCNINLNLSTGVSERTISHLMELFPKLSSLHLQGQGAIMTTRSIANLIKFPNLKSLQLKNIINNRDLSIENIFSKLTDSCPSLCEFTLQDSSCLTDNCIQHLVMSCNLEVLDLNGSISLTDVTMNNIGIYCKKLKILRIGKSPGITDEGVKEINFSWCRNITGSGIAYLIQKCKNSLRKLFLNECSSISPDAVYYARAVLGTYEGTKYVCTKFSEENIERKNMNEGIQNIYIRDTETRNTPKPHIVYRVEVHAAVRTWSIWKRYSEFEELNYKLVRIFPLNPPPYEMPVKHYFQSTLGNPALVEERRRGLEEFLRGILFHKDDRWRETDEWKEFLAIPTGRPLDASAMYTSESWLDECNQAQSITKEIRSLLNRRETHIARNEVQASHNCGVQAKKNLTTLGVRVSQLESGLIGLAKGTGRDRKTMSEGELRRRQDILNDLKDEKDTLTKLVLANRPDISKSTTPASSGDRASLFRQPVQPISKRAPPSRRVFGNTRALPAETELTRGLDNEGLVNLQKTTMEDQERHVEQFSAILSRHKQLGLAIGQELEIQNQMLSELDEGIDQTSSKLRFTTRKMNSIK